MDRISTSNAYGTVLSNIMAAEIRQSTAGEKVSSQKNATDLKGYAANSETLAALQAVQTKVNGYLDQTDTLTNKLATQDTALNQVADAAQGARQAIADALASGRGDTLMQSLQGFYQDAAQGLNTKFNGHFLFAGGQANTQPVSATSLAALAAAPSTASVFHNDQLVTTNQLDESTSIQTGFLADQVGTNLFNDFKAVEAFNQGAGGPFNGQLTAAQITFLQGQLATFDTDHSNLINVAGQNGLLQNQVDAAKTDLQGRQTMGEGLLGNLTAVDMAKAVSDLQQAQLSVQAAAQVFSSLKSSSLLNFLSVG
jgi:flagellar hook-associated protein 3 FlgL